MHPSGRPVKKLLLSLALAVSALPARAEESMFAYVYTTDLLPKGAMELEQSLTWRHQKSQGEFDDWQGTTSFEYGLTDYLQVAAYGNYDKASAYHNDVEGKTVAPERFEDMNVDPNGRFDSLKWVGVSFEGIFVFSAPTPLRWVWPFTLSRPGVRICLNLSQS